MPRNLNQIVRFMEKIIQKNKHHINHSFNHDMSDSEGELGIFEEPEGFYEAEKEPSFVDYTLQSGLKLNLRLVGHNPLWVSFLAPACPHGLQVFFCWCSASHHRRVLKGFVGLPWPESRVRQFELPCHMATELPPV